MKKLMIGVVCCVVTTICGLADNVSLAATRSAKQILSKPYSDRYAARIMPIEWEGIFDNIISNTSRTGAVKYIGTKGNRFYNYWLKNCDTEFAAKYDGLLSSKGIGVAPLYYSKFPLSVELVFNRNPKYVSFHPVYIRELRKYKTANTTQWGFASRLNLLIEQLALGATLGIEQGEGRSTLEVPNVLSAPSTLHNAKKEILNQAVSVVKMALRASGETFVVGSNKVNKVQAAIASLATALNSPKMQGAGEWVAVWCPDYEWIEPIWPSAIWIANYKDSIFNGKREFTPHRQAWLIALLGISEYNVFVKQYNEPTPNSSSAEL